VEAAVLGSRLAAGQGTLPFLPLALTGFSALTASGGPEARLAGWISGAHRAVLSALMTLDRLASWRARAEADTADLQGRTPALLIASMAAHPMLAAPQAEAETGASRAAVQRNLDVLQARGLIREVTGQGRFRVWAAAI
jgi:Fic family protein